MAEETKAAAKEQKKLKPGDTVHLVTGRLARVKAKVLKVHDDGKIDVKAIVGKETHTITACPCDAEGKTPDTWHHCPDEEGEPAPAKA